MSVDPRLAAQTRSRLKAVSLLLVLAVLFCPIYGCGSDAGGSTGSARRSTNNAAAWLGHRYRAADAQSGGLPRDVRRKVGRGQQGFMVAAARRVKLVAPGRYWLVPKAGWACLIGQLASTLGSSCIRMAQSAKKPLAIVIIRPEPILGPVRTVVGIVPRGVRAVCLVDHLSKRVLNVDADGAFGQTEQASSPPTQIYIPSRRRPCQGVDFSPPARR